MLHESEIDTNIIIYGHHAAQKEQLASYMVWNCYNHSIPTFEAFMHTWKQIKQYYSKLRTSYTALSSFQKELWKRLTFVRNLQKKLSILSYKMRTHNNQVLETFFKY